MNYSDKNRKSVERAAASFAPEKSTLLFPRFVVPLSREFVYFGEGRQNVALPVSMTNAMIEQIVVAAVVGWQESSVGLVTH